MSEVRKMRDAVGLFKDYDDCWYIGGMRSQKIAVELARALREKIIQSKNTDHPIIIGTFENGDLNIHCRHELVTYMPRTLHVVNDGDADIEKFTSLMQDMAFIKPKSFSHEKEYRFSFLIIINNKIQEPEFNSVILDVPDLVSFVI